MISVIIHADSSAGICDLLDIDNSQNKQLNRKDLNRFKEVLVGLRKQGERAPGAAGY